MLASRPRALTTTLQPHVSFTHSLIQQAQDIASAIHQSNSTAATSQHASWKSIIVMQRLTRVHMQRCSCHSRTARSRITSQPVHAVNVPCSNITCTGIPTVITDHTFTQKQCHNTTNSSSKLTNSHALKIAAVISDHLSSSCNFQTQRLFQGVQETFQILSSAVHVEVVTCNFHQFTYIPKTSSKATNSHALNVATQTIHPEATHAQIPLI